MRARRLREDGAVFAQRIRTPLVESAGKRTWRPHDLFHTRGSGGCLLVTDVSDPATTSPPNGGNTFPDSWTSPFDDEGMA
ncbi:hypothetical protein ACFPM0_03125 [Pseudonocardia sulfidoxydans]|uniref:hypothetical protein n=1 Tax=Pseudonocardia sulfidoxydans TaxID=54011 RepID=UPI00361DF8EB